jgi:hypothetical protein
MSESSAAITKDDVEAYTATAEIEMDACEDIDGAYVQILRQNLNKGFNLFDDFVSLLFGIQ